MVTLLLISLLAAPDPAEAPKLIAHRGGIVDDRCPENSLASLNAAISRGYWMVEVDVRRTRDGEPVLLHDKSLKRACGVEKNVADLTWEEMRQLRSTVDSTPPCSLGEFAARCQGRTRIMVDTQENGAEGGFFEKMEETLRENGLLESAFFIGSAEMKAYFKGKARVAASRKTIAEAVAAGEPVSTLYFLFAHGNELDKETVQYARSLNVPIVASVNRLHYIVRHGKPTTAESDIRNLLKWGVEYYQIDSNYEPFFAKKK